MCASKNFLRRRRLRRAGAHTKFRAIRLPVWGAQIGN
jgi:hypothetical protein